MKNRPDIYKYLNYREYLKDYYTALKAIDKKFSYRYISQKVGSSSPSWLSDIIQGRINLTESYIPKVTTLLELGKKESRFFKLLVSYDQAPLHDLKKEYLEKILASRDIKVDILTQKKFDYFKNWYTPVIREYLMISNFNGADFKNLAKAVLPKISEKEAKEAIGVLLSLDLIDEDEKGDLKPTQKTVTKDSSIASVYIPAYQKENLRLATESIERFKKDERNISSVTVSLSKAQYLHACSEISKLRETLLTMSNTADETETVYQCNIQLFPVTTEGESK